MHDEDFRQAAANPYAAPAATPERVDESDSIESYARAFVGPRDAYYLGNWHLSEDQDRATGFNLAAFLLGPIWAGYRKMYLVGAIFGGVILLETVVEELVLHALGRAETPAMWNLGVNLATATICGVFANRCYLWHARRQIEKVQWQGLRGAAAIQKLKRRGGTSVVGAIGLMIIYLMLVIFVFAILDLILFGPEVFLSADELVI